MQKSPQRKYQQYHCTKIVSLSKVHCSVRIPRITLGGESLQYCDQACASGPCAADLPCLGQVAQCPGHAASGLPSACPSESSWLRLCGTMGSVTRLFCTHFALRIFKNSSRNLKYCLTWTGIILSHESYSTGKILLNQCLGVVFFTVDRAWKHLSDGSCWHLT